jgi:putative FmdB family regulatory protein
VTYVFFCEPCGYRHDVDRPVSAHSDPCPCPSCGDGMRRLYTPPQIITPGEQKAYFHPALGQVVKGDLEAKKLAKERGWNEIGTEDPKKHAAKPKRHNYEFNDYFV